MYLVQTPNVAGYVNFTPEIGPHVFQRRYGIGSSAFLITERHGGLPVADRFLETATRGGAALETPGHNGMSSIWLRRKPR